MTTIILTSGTSWTVPSDWNSASNLIETWGGAAGGSSDNFTSTISSGGGGGAYISIQNLSLSVASIIAYVIGIGGAGETGSVAAKPGGDTWFNGSTLALSSVGAKGGSIATGSTTGGVGGLATACIPASGFFARFNGGTGGKGNASGSGAGGGGSAGPDGAGLVGVAAASGTGNGGAGGAGDNGLGGAGGATGTAAGAGNAGAANNAGGGGGGGAKGQSAAATGGAGGLPGGAGGGGSTDGSASLGGLGAGGQIRITYTPASSGVALAGQTAMMVMASAVFASSAFISGMTAMQIKAGISGAFKLAMPGGSTSLQVKGKAQALYKAVLSGMSSAFQVKASLGIPAMHFLLSGKTAFQIKSRLVFQGVTSLSGKSSTQVKARAGAIYSIALAGKTATQLKAQTQAILKTMLAGRTALQVKGALLFNGLVSLSGQSQFQVKGKAGNIKFLAFLTGATSAMVKAGLTFAGKTLLSGKTATQVSGQAGGTFRLFISGKTATQLKASLSKAKFVAFLHGLSAFQVKGHAKLKRASSVIPSRLLLCAYEPYGLALSNAVSYALTMSAEPATYLQLTEAYKMQCCNDREPILIGNELTLMGTFTNKMTGQPADPGTIVLTIQDPTGDVETFTPTKQGTGVYTYDYIFDVAGVYTYQFSGTGGVTAVGEKNVTVLASAISS